MILAGSSLLYSRLSLEDACERLGDIGFATVDLGVMEGWAHVDPSEVVGRIDETVTRIEVACDAGGLEPVAFNADAGIDDRDKEVERVRALAAVADELGVGTITLQGGSSNGNLEADLDRFRALMDATNAFDVALAVETHWGTHLEDPRIAARYPEMVPGLALTLDPGHYAIGPHWEAGYEHLLADITHVHLRQAGDGWENVQRPPDDGKIDFEAVLADLEGVGYDGAVAVEYIDSLDGIDPVEAERSAAELRELLAARLE